MQRSPAFQLTMQLPLECRPPDDNNEAAKSGGAMTKFAESRRDFLKTAGFTAGAGLLSLSGCTGRGGTPAEHGESTSVPAESGPADYTLRIKTSPVEPATARIVSVTT